MILDLHFYPSYIRDSISVKTKLFVSVYKFFIRSLCAIVASNFMCYISEDFIQILILNLIYHLVRMNEVSLLIFITVIDKKLKLLEE